MEIYKKEFIEFMVRSNVLTFGKFTTKSGRLTPYFINTGNYKTGIQMKKLGEYYSQAINSIIKTDFTLLFGPAYKGIPLVVTTAIALSTLYNKDVSFCFNRKEIKGHGEGGAIVGQVPMNGDRVVIIEDVTTAGTSIRETVPLLRQCGSVTLMGLVVSVDRMEKGSGQTSALKDLKQEFAMETGAIVTIQDIISYLYNKEIDGKVILTDGIKKDIETYLKKFGA